MKVDIMFLVNHFQKVGESIFVFHYFLYTKKSSNERAHDVKVPTQYENESDHPIWPGNFLKNLDFEFNETVLH